MMWQDAVFLLGSVFSIAVLAPTLRDSTARVPLGTSAPSALIGLIYGATFLSMGMAFSGAGSALAGLMWSLIAFLRAPESDESTAAASTQESAPRSKAAAPNAD